MKSNSDYTKTDNIKGRNRDMTSEILPDRSVQQALVEGEHILFQGVMHYAIFLFPAIYLFAGLLVFVFFHWIVGTFIWVLAAYPVLNAYILYKTAKLILTDKRIFARYGFFERDLMQFRHDRIESIHLERPFIGQLLGYATVVIRGTGSGVIPIPFIQNGSSFVRQYEEYTLADDPKKSDKEADENPSKDSVKA